MFLQKLRVPVPILLLKGVPILDKNFVKVQVWGLKDCEQDNFARKGDI